MRGILRIFTGLALVAAAAGFVSSCRKTTSPREFPIFRIIDSLRDEGVRRSPLLGKRAGGLREADFPVFSWRLRDSGAGENGLGLKRKIKLGLSETNILFAPPLSEYSVKTEIPTGAILDFGIGIVRDMNSEARAAAGGDDAIHFFVSLEIAGRRRTLDQKHLTKPEVRPERTVNFARHRIEIPPLQGKISLIFRTTGPEGTFAFWENPILYVPSAGHPNILLISIDTLRADHLGCYGYGRDTSPAMDALARDGILFERAYASSPWTLPSHVSMLTGLHTVRHQVYSRDNQIDPELPTLADRLRTNSYFCAALTGGAYLDPMFGFARGFDEYEVRDGETDRRKLAANRYATVSRWLERRTQVPFFLFVHTYQVHSPYMSPEPFNSMFLDPGSKLTSFDILGDLDEGRAVFKPFSEAERRNIIGLYDGEIRFTDEVFVKGMIQKLRDLGLYDRTMIILTSDHGEQFYEHGSWNHGNFLFDDALRVPLIVKFPGSRHRGRRVDSPVRLVDLVPTILEEAGVAFEGPEFDGESLVPLSEKRSAPARTILADAIEENDEHGAGKIPRRIAVSDGPLKVIFDQGYRPDYLEILTFPAPERKPYEAYDLVQDPGETKDISADRVETVRRLRALVEEIYRKAPPRRTSRSAINGDVEKQLRALGYIR